MTDENFNDPVFAGRHGRQICSEEESVRGYCLFCYAGAFPSEGEEVAAAHLHVTYGQEVPSFCQEDGAFPFPGRMGTVVVHHLFPVDPQAAAVVGGEEEGIIPCGGYEEAGGDAQGKTVFVVRDLLEVELVEDTLCGR